jgi:integrase/recombinase XerD
MDAPAAVPNMLQAIRTRQRGRTDPSLSTLVQDYLLAKEASGRAPATLDCYRIRLSRLVAFLGDPAVTSITATDLRRWLVALKSGRIRPTTGVYVEGHRAVAEGLFTWAVSEGRLRQSPTSGVERYRGDRPPIRTLTRSEVAMLLAQQPDTAMGRRNRAMLAFMYDTGVRAAELVRLRLEDVDLGAGQARIQGKNRRVETVPLSPALRSLLLGYLRDDRSRASNATPALFLSRDGSAVTTNAIRLWMRRAKVPAGLEGKRVSPHVIRASAATHFAASGVSAFGVQRFLRHRTPTMSQRYVDLGSIDFARLHANSSPFQQLSRQGARSGLRRARPR